MRVDDADDDADSGPPTVPQGTRCLAWQRPEPERPCSCTQHCANRCRDCKLKRGEGACSCACHSKQTLPPPSHESRVLEQATVVDRLETKLHAERAKLAALRMKEVER